MEYAVFVCDEEDGAQFFAAKDEQSALAEHYEMFGRQPVKIRQMSETEIDAARVAETDENEELTGETISLRDHLHSEAEGETRPAFFLCGEE